MVVDTKQQRSPLRRLRSNDIEKRSREKEKVENNDPLDFLNPASTAEYPSPPRTNAKRVAEAPLDQPLAKKGKKGKPNTSTENTKAALISSRHAFLAKHRGIFEPLLSSKSQLFSHLSSQKHLLGLYRARRELEDQPSLIQNGEMKDYQLTGLSFLAWMHSNGMNSILGDEMGLGKTLQTLSLFAHVRENYQADSEPQLVICPLSVLSSWMAEAERWLPSFKTVKFHSNQNERVRMKEVLKSGNFDIMVTTYEMFVAEESWFKSRRWNYCVLDEGHKIKGSATLIHAKLQGIGSQHRLILTGTPLQNNLQELWSLLHWLYPELFTPATEKKFTDSFDLTKGQYDVKFLEAARGLLKLIMLRRTKQVVDLSIPSREEMVVYLPLTEAQRFWYYRLLLKTDTLTLKEIFKDQSSTYKGRDDAQEQVAQALKQSASSLRQGAKVQSYQKLMNLLMQLRRICDHPYILNGCLPDPYEIGEHIIASSSKLIFLDKLLGELLPKGERVLIFSQWTSMLDMLEDFMFLRDVPYARLDGSVNRARRALDIKLFQQEKSPYQVFLISTRAGGLGINLTKAEHVVLFDCSWNPQDELQAIARAHRIGQRKTVKVYRLICQESVEDQMLDRIKKKLFLSIKVMSSDGRNNDESMSSLKTSELLSMLSRGSGALAKRASDSEDKGLTEFINAPIASILQRSKQQEDRREYKLKKELDQETQDDEQMDLDLIEEETQILQGITQVQSRLFEGVHHGSKFMNNNLKSITKEWTEKQKRVRDNRLVMYNGVECLPDRTFGPQSVLSIKSDISEETKRRKRSFDHEDYCHFCRDGGDMLCCSTCPRVFHRECAGVGERRLKGTINCAQHACWSCERKTAEAGGMLYRCRTCPSAYCEDCLPEGELAAVGPTLPEFVLLGYGENSQAYFINCSDCLASAESDPTWKQSWVEEDLNAKRKLTELRAATLEPSSVASLP